jgi:hypothetical protein
MMVRFFLASRLPFRSSTALTKVLRSIYPLILSTRSANHFTDWLLPSLGQPEANVWFPESFFGDFRWRGNQHYRLQPILLLWSRKSKRNVLACLFSHKPRICEHLSRDVKN